MEGCIRTGAPWRDLPKHYGLWKTIFHRFRRWSKLGYFLAIFEAIQIEPDNACHSIDSTYARAHQHSAGASVDTHRNAIGQSVAGRTTKIHARVDANGRPLQIHVTSGQVHDTKGAVELLKSIPNKTNLIADKAYDSQAIVDKIENQNATAVIPSKKNRKKPRLIDNKIYKERNHVERFFAKLKQYRVHGVS